MYCNKKILAIIPARGGSKGIPNKNIKELLGKPLIGYTIEAAKQSKYIDEVVVSTDSETIKTVAKKFGAKIPFLRPQSLSDDYAKSIDVVIHCVKYLEDLNEYYDYIILLQPTSPFRTNIDIDIAIETIISININSLVSVCEVEQNPVLMRIIENNKLRKIINYERLDLRRQDLPSYYIFNGAIYINSRDMLFEKKCFVDENTMPFIMSKEKSLDIDTYVDFDIAEILMKENKNDKDRQ